jgi:hypothetical protein
MTKDQIKAIFDRVLTWPPDRQEEAAEMLLLLEGQEGEVYQPSDDEWEAIREGMRQAQRGEFVADEEVAALLKRLSA